MYCKVNVALNEVVVEKMFDMVDYPVIEEGDDLTEKSSGIANIILAHVHFQNGSILNITKKVNAIQYTSGITVENSKNAETSKTAENSLKINGIEIKKDENGVLKVGDVIIPQKKLLYSGSGSATVNLSTSINPGDIIEITFSSRVVKKFIVGSTTTALGYITKAYGLDDNDDDGDDDVYIDYAGIEILSNNQLRISRPKVSVIGNSTSSSSVVHTFDGNSSLKIVKVYKVIE